MEEVDIFSSSKITEPPCIFIRTHPVTDADDFMKDLEYSLNVNCIQRVFDETPLQGSSQPQIDITVSLDDYIHSECMTQNYLLVNLIEVTLTLKVLLDVSIMAPYSYCQMSIFISLYFSSFKYSS